jgi:Ca2+-binding RTX toxin-like protein
MRLAALLAALLAVALVSVAALTASVSVPVSHLGGEVAAAPSPAELAPAACAGLPLTSLTGPEGTGEADLVLGTAAGEQLRGKNRADCLVGGDGDDDLNGGPGIDVCIGGAGTDTYTACETQLP